MRGVSKKGLPAEFQEVEYLQSTGQQFMNLQLDINPETAKIKIEGQFVTPELATVNPFMVMTVPVNVLGLGAVRNGGKIMTFCNRYSSDRSTLKYMNTVTKKLAESGTNALNADVLYDSFNIIEQTVEYTKINNDTYSASDFLNNEHITYTNVTLCIFSHLSSSGNRYHHCRIKFCEIYDDNVLICKLIPCYRKSDNVAGMYDTVRQIFFINQDESGVNFITGGEVN